MNIEKPLLLSITEGDLNIKERQELEVELRETRRLGGAEQEATHRAILDLLPTVIAKRVEGIIPDEFELVELELKFSIEGKIFGAGVGGEAVAKLRKKA